MNDKAKPFSAKRWTDIPRFVVVGHSEFTEEEKKENEKKKEEIMRSYGALAPNEHVRNGKVVKE